MNTLRNKIKKIDTEIDKLERQKKIFEMELFIFNYPFLKGDLLIEGENGNIYFFVKHDYVYGIQSNENELTFKLCLIDNDDNFIFNDNSIFPNIVISFGDFDIWKPRILKCGNCSQDVAWRSESLDINQLQCQKCGIVTKFALLIAVELCACDWCNTMYPKQELSDSCFGNAVCSSCAIKKMDEWSKGRLNK